MAERGPRFTHSTPELYDRYLGPLLFEPYARVLAAHAAQLKPDRILETAAGTGALTRALHEAIPHAHIVATDLNPAMLGVAGQRLESHRITYQPADAQNLPFEPGHFDVVVCQFGAMFFPDRLRAYEEARRVLRSDGHFLVVSFDSLERNPVPKAVGEAVGALFPHDPPEYMERGPFSYTNPSRIQGDLQAAGFIRVELQVVELKTRVSARDAAQGMVLGSPLRSEIERRDPAALDRALNAATAALAPWDAADAPMSAHLAIAAK